MKTCLVLEGGALRGIYTAGVLDELMKEDIKIDAIIGVSMGALVGINYCSRQRGRALRYNLNYCRDKRYIGIRSLIKTGDIVNKEFAYYTLPNELDKFDYKEFNKSKTRFYCTVTNVESGKAEYYEITDSLKQIEYLRAGGSIPGVSKIVSINNKKYLDGGIGDSIPVRKAIELGYDKIIVVTTRPIEYRKSEKMLKILKIKYRKYPNFVKSLESRGRRYNKTVEEIIKLEKKHKIFVIRPSKTVPIKRIEHNPLMIQAQYDLGVSDFQKQLVDLKKYLKK